MEQTTRWPGAMRGGDFNDVEMYAIVKSRQELDFDMKEKPDIALWLLTIGTYRIKYAKGTSSSQQSGDVGANEALWPPRITGQ